MMEVQTDQKLYLSKINVTYKVSSLAKGDNSIIHVRSISSPLTSEDAYKGAFHYHSLHVPATLSVNLATLNYTTKIVH